MLARTWKNWSLHILLVEIQTGVTTWEISLAAPQKVKPRVTIWPSNPTLRLVPKGVKMYIHTKPCTWVFTEALSQTVRKVKRTQHASTDDDGSTNGGISLQWDIIQLQKWVKS